jgi:hypothetical protein
VTATVRIGDPDPTPVLADNLDYCWAPRRIPGRVPTAYCSWPVEHSGDHVSADVGRGVSAVWSGDEPPSGRVWSPRDQPPWVFGPSVYVSVDAWTDAMARAGREIGVNRQCSIGWHDECSDPEGASCLCACHGGVS